MTKNRTHTHRLGYPADDRFVRFVFSNMVRMAGLLRFTLPLEITDLMEFSGLRRLHDQQVGKNLHELRDDLSLECSLKGGRGKSITLNILKLSQLKTLTLDNIKRVLTTGLPDLTQGRQRRFLQAAMSYTLKGGMC